MPPLCIEYAKSARAMCANKQCAKNIDQGELRIGTAKMMQLAGNDATSFSYRHLCCFTKRQLVSLTSIDQLDGFDDLDTADQTHAEDLVKGKLEGKLELRGKLGRVGAAAPPSPTKKKKASPAKSAASDSDDGGGGGAGPPAKKKAKKDPLAPRQPKTALAYFKEHERASVKVDRPGLSVKEINEELKKRWFELSDDDGRKFRDLEKNDVKRYLEDKKAYDDAAAAALTAAAAAAAPAPAAPAQAAAPPPPALLPVPAAPAADTRPVCEYGAGCYRKNPQHFKDFRHPGSDPPAPTPPAVPMPVPAAAAAAVPVPATPDSPAMTPTPAFAAVTLPPAAGPSFPKCQWGSKCFRKHKAEHRSMYFHPDESDSESE
eukprot:Rhum_TRINITY_DN7461_c0_g1::Rhum_TRINITY_DN7461_c0_g1_i1::g.22814::m.22814